MAFDTYLELEKLLKEHGPQEFGRISQALLELSLIKVGFITRGRPVERPDITAQRKDLNYAIECKAQKGSEVSLTQRDLDGVMEFSSSGVIPCIAVLDMGINPKWILLRADALKPGKYNKTSLGIYALHELSDEINSVFPDMVENYCQIAMGRGSEGLRSNINLQH